MIYLVLGVGMLALIVALVTSSQKRRERAIDVTLIVLLIALIFGGQW